MWNEPFQNLIGLQFFEVLMCTSENLSWYSSLFSSVTAYRKTGKTDVHKHQTNTHISSFSPFQDTYSL